MGLCPPEHDHEDPVCAEYIAAVYADMRLEEAQTEQPHSYTTARTLLSILRLSQALARLRLDNVITQVLMHPSKDIGRM